MTDKKYLLTAISTVAAASFSLSAMAAGDNIDPFQAEDLPAGFQVSADDDKEGSCGEGSCGEGDDKDKEGSCGEGSCGEDDSGGEGSCGEGSCGGDDSGGDDSGGEGACGEGTCGSA